MPERRFSHEKTKSSFYEAGASPAESGWDFSSRVSINQALVLESSHPYTYPKSSQLTLNLS